MAEASRTEDSGITLRIRFKSETIEKFVERYAADLSPGGIFIRTREPLAVGTKLAFEFSLVDGSPLLNGQGVVAWVRDPASTRAGVPSGMGLRFENLGPEAQAKLNGMLAEKAKRQGAPAVRYTMPVMEAVRADALRAPAPEVAPAGAREGAPKSAPRIAAVTPDLDRRPVAEDGGGRRDTAARGAAQQGGVVGEGVDEVVGDGWSEDKTEIAALPPSFYFDKAEQSLANEAGSLATALPRPLSEDVEETTNPRAGAEGRAGAGAPPIRREKTLAFDPAAGLGPASGFRAPTPASGIPAGRAPTPAGGLPQRRTGSGMAAVQTGGPQAGRAPTPATGLPGRTPTPVLGFSQSGATLPGTGGVPTPSEGAPILGRSGTPRGGVSFEGVGGEGGAPLEGFGRSPTPAAGFEGSGGTQGRRDSVPDLGLNDLGGRDVGMEAPAGPLANRLQDQRGGRGKAFAGIGIAAGVVVLGAIAYSQISKAPPTPTPPPSASAPAVPSSPAAEPTPGTPGATPPVGASAPPGPNAAPGGTPPGAPQAAAEPPPAAKAAADKAGASDDRRPAAEPPAVAAKSVPAPKPTPKEPARPAAAKFGRPGQRSAKEALDEARAKEGPVAAGALEGAAAPLRAEPRGEGAPGEPAAEAPASSAAEELFMLTVKSTPDGADVLIDGLVEGKTPFVRRIFDPNRPYAITIRKAGFEPQERMLSSSDDWARKGKVRTLTISAKLAKVKEGEGASEAEAPRPAEASPGAPEDEAPAPVTP